MTRPLFFITLVLASVLSVSAMAAETLREIRINGSQRVEPATVLTYLNLQTGQPLTDETINEGLKNLFATGLFADVKMRQDGGVLLVDVVDQVTC